MEFPVLQEMKPPAGNLLTSPFAFDFNYPTAAFWRSAASQWLPTRQNWMNAAARFLPVC